MNTSTTIKAIGIGSAGCIIVNHLLEQEIKGVCFMVCDTDARVFENSVVPNKILLDKPISKTIEQPLDLQCNSVFDAMLSGNTTIALIIAEKGDPVVPNIIPVLTQKAKEREIVTVGIVVIPFPSEGKSGYEKTLLEIEKLYKQFDTLLIVDYNKAIHHNEKLDYETVFPTPNEVLVTIVKGIAAMVSHLSKNESKLNFIIKRIFCNSGTAFVGSSVVSGENRAKRAIEAALFSPLMKDNTITNAKNVLLLITSFTVEINIDEIGEISDYIQAESGFYANVILCVGDDASLGEAIGITLIATGFDILENLI